MEKGMDELRYARHIERRNAAADADLYEKTIFQEKITETAVVNEPENAEKEEITYTISSEESMQIHNTSDLLPTISACRETGVRKYRHLDLPYPPVEGIQANTAYANIIRHLYSGAKSELTATLQYIFGSLQMRAEHKDIYEALKQISISEMVHIDLLGQVLMSLCADPRFTYKTATAAESFWSSRTVNYATGAQSILLEGIALEENTIREYETAIGKIKDEKVTAILRRIILDEKEHLNVFKELYIKKINVSRN